MKPEQELRARLARFLPELAPDMWIYWFWELQNLEVGPELKKRLFDESGVRDFEAADFVNEMVDYLCQTPAVAAIVERDMLICEGGNAASGTDDLVDECQHGADPKELVASDPTISDEFTYECGVWPGQYLYLVKDLPVTDHLGKVVQVFKSGQRWMVMSPSTPVWAINPSPDVPVWLVQPDGDQHTWDDDDSLFEYFETRD
jgi:hypothetical protein